MPRSDRGGLPWSKPRGDGMSAKPFRATADELGRETWTSRRAVTNYMGYQSSFVATVTASGWYGRFSWLGAWLVRGISVASPRQTAAAAHSAAARHSRSVSSTKTRARTLARSSTVRTAHVLLCAASRDTVNIFWVEPNVVGVVTLLCGGRVKEPTARTGFQSAHAADRA